MITDLKSCNREEIVKRISDRKKELKHACKELKKHFVGIDYVINKLEKLLSPWYCLPELLTRPVVICLYGPTGVGKTDLVRRLVKLLNFQDKFCEIEMMNKGNSSTYTWHSSISSILASNPKIESGKPCILLLDEIQNFRTINEEGHELPEYKYRDIWTLLSDGKLPFKLELDYLIQLLYELTEREKKEAENKDKKLLPKASLKRGVLDKRLLSSHDSDEISLAPEYDVNSLEDDDYDGDCDGDKTGDAYGTVTVETTSNTPRTDLLDDIEDKEDTSYYSLRQFKNMLRLSESIEEIAGWSTSKKKAVLIEKINDQSLYEEVDYTKSLIFVSGNLDEAYEFAKKTNEVDVNADIFNKLSMKINILDIKSALMVRFKPEQIARFGNMQIIYPTLSKNSYEVIIQRKIKEVIDNVKARCNVTMMIDKSINNLIYENGVFPTQGTRPVFSTISEIMESPLPSFLLNAFSNGVKNIRLFYENGNICAEIKNSILKYPYRGTIDKLRSDRNKNMDRRTLNAVHEAGHAVVYAELFHSPPPQTSALTASTEISGFVWVHEICGSKEMIENKICAVLAGIVAERVVFGIQNTTWGGQEDLQEATKLAGAMAKRYAMDKFSSFIMHPQRSDVVNTDVNSANPVIEEIMSKFKVKTEEILEQRKELFNDTVDFLLANKELSPENFKKICAKQGLKLHLSESEETLYSDYHRQYQDFKKIKK